MDALCSINPTNARRRLLSDKFDSLAGRDGIRANAFKAFVLQYSSHVDHLQIYVRLPPLFFVSRREFVRSSLFLVNKKIYIFVSAFSSGSYYMEHSTSI